MLTEVSEWSLAWQRSCAVGVSAWLGQCSSPRNLNAAIQYSCRRCYTDYKCGVSKTVNNADPADAADQLLRLHAGIVICCDRRCRRLIRGHYNISGFCRPSGSAADFGDLRWSVVICGVYADVFYSDRWGCLQYLSVYVHAECRQFPLLEPCSTVKEPALPTSCLYIRTS